MKKLKSLAIIVLMMIILMILGIKVEATNEQDSTELQTNSQKNVDEPLTDISNDIKENKKYTLKQEIGIKILPLMSSREKAKVNGQIETIEIINDWCRIESDTESGWVRVNSLKKAVTQVEETETPEEPIQLEEPKEPDEMEQPNDEKEDTIPVQEEPKTPTPMNKTGYVDADGLIVREGPSTSTKELDSLSRNDKLNIIGEIDGWYKIKLNGEIGYVSAKYVSDTKVPETTSRSGSSLKVPEVTPIETPESKEEKPKTEEKTESSSGKMENSAGTTGNAVVEYAKQYLGYKYVSGGASPSTGFDCSGFTSYVYKHFGISLNRTSRDQIKNGVAVQRSNLQPGDLVIFNNSGNTAIGHVGIYVGGDNFIHAANKNEGVKITSLSSSYYKKRYVGARRVI